MLCIHWSTIFVRSFWNITSIFVMISKHVYIFSIFHASRYLILCRKELQRYSVYIFRYHSMLDIPPSYPLLYAFYTLSHSVLTLSWRSGLAPALRRSSTTFWWPFLLACCSAVQPFCMVEKVIVTAWDGCIITVWWKCKFKFMSLLK